MSDVSYNLAPSDQSKSLTPEPVPVMDDATHYATMSLLAHRQEDDLVNATTWEPVPDSQEDLVDICKKAVALTTRQFRLSSQDRPAAIRICSSASDPQEAHGGTTSWP